MRLPLFYCLLRIAASLAGCLPGSTRAASISAKVIAQPKCLVAVARTIELAPGIALDVSRLFVTPTVIDWPVAIGPHMQRTRRVASCLLACLGIDVHRAPDV